MNDSHREPSPYRPFAPVAGELVADYRERIARYQLEVEQRRAHELAEQSSTLNAPAERIRIWEQRHGLPLPTSPSHRLLDVVAAGTGLSLEEVQEEQLSRRNARRAPATPAAS